jgi:hypothetical protein
MRTSLQEINHFEPLVGHVLPNKNNTIEIIIEGTSNNGTPIFIKVQCKR